MDQVLSEVFEPGIQRSHGAEWRGVVAALCGLLFGSCAWAGGPSGSVAYHVETPIIHGNLAIFPVTGEGAHDTSQFLTLDEGVRTGQVTVTEAGDERGMIRPGQPIPPRRGGAEVNRLVLYNNSSRPLLLLAGEIVTGGKQDRVVGSDRIVPANTGPVDLGVFCVEPGRWVESSAKFGSMGVQMAQPSVRMPAMAEQNQSRVWESVRASSGRMAHNVDSPDVQAAVAGTTSYAKVFASPPVAQAMAHYGGSETEQSILRELRARKALGVVVAIDGRVMWADVFASTDLLAKYWSKLMHSYVAEAMTSARGAGTPDQHEAELFIHTLGGGREVVETEADVFRRSEITGEGYRVFTLTSLLPKAEYEVHLTKLRQ
jgi:hypothetical protein